MRKTTSRIALNGLAGAMALLAVAAPPAVATYGGNDGRLYFGAFDPANRRSADLYSTHADGADLRQLTESANQRDICPAISADGKRVALCSDRTGSYEIWTMNANGKALAQLTALGGYSVFPDWSPAGDRIAFTHGTPDNPDLTGIWVADSATGAAQRLIPAATAPGLWADAYPAWSPDGTTVLFVRQRLNEDGDPFPIEGQLWLYKLGSGTATQLTADPTVKDQVPDWSPDGSRIAYGADDDVWVMNADGSGAVNLTHSDAAEFGAAWSPRGGWIAFTGAGADVPLGQRYVQVMRADGSDRRVVAPTPGLLQAVAGWQPLGGGR